MIRLQFVAADDVGSRLIQYFSAGHLSHVDAVVDDAAIGILGPAAAGAAPGWLLGARSDRVGGKPRGVQIRPPDYAAWSRRVVVTIPASPEQVATFWTFHRDKTLGRPYDWRAILGFLFNRDWRHDGAWICSEAQAGAEEAAKLCGRLFLASYKITPVALALADSALPDVTIEVFA